MNNSKARPDADNGSDHETDVGKADADESGYRRDDYWRAAQEDIEPGDEANAKAYRDRDTVRPDASDDERDPPGPAPDGTGARQHGKDPGQREDDRQD